jgi:hypothetical protein
MISKLMLLVTIAAASPLNTNLGAIVAGKDAATYLLVSTSPVCVTNASMM